MLNTILSIAPWQGWVLIFCSFSLCFGIRYLYLKRVVCAFLYHISLFIVLFFKSIVGFSVAGDGYKRLDLFISLEKNNELAFAKKNPQQYDSMFAIDLEQFKNSAEFREYLEDIGYGALNASFIGLGWMCAFLSDILILCIGFIIRGYRYIFRLSGVSV